MTSTLHRTGDGASTTTTFTGGHDTDPRYQAPGAVPDVRL
jgi:hypothetical protein